MVPQLVMVSPTVWDPATAGMSASDVIGAIWGAMAPFKDYMVLFVAIPVAFNLLGRLFRLVRDIGFGRPHGVAPFSGDRQFRNQAAASRAFMNANMVQGDDYYTSRRNGGIFGAGARFAGAGRRFVSRRLAARRSALGVQSRLARYAGDEEESGGVGLSRSGLLIASRLARYGRSGVGPGDAHDRASGGAVVNSRRQFGFSAAGGALRRRLRRK